MKVGFERFRFSRDGKSPERQEAWVEIKPSKNLETEEMRKFAALFKKFPNWATGRPTKRGIGWSSALPIR